MTDLTIVTFDWVPVFPRGFVRDIRIRWALEEAGLRYQVISVPFRDRKADHFLHQPFGQVPWLEDGDTSIFESGAAILHLALKYDVLMPPEEKGRSNVMQWLFASLNSVEAAALPWFILAFSDLPRDTEEWKRIDGFLQLRLGHMEDVLAEREWLTGAFSVADIVMVDVFRVIDRFDALADYPACRAYVGRATARPAFVKARTDQIAHFEAAD